MSDNFSTEGVTSALPYNESNVLLEIKDVVKFLSDYGVEGQPNDINLYRMAFINKSYCTRKNENAMNGNFECPANCLPLQEWSNERLEFLGDAVLNLVVGDYLYERYCKENEGFLTKMRTKLVNGKMLANLAEKVGFGKFMVIAKQIEESNGRKNKKLLEDTFEAFIGAIFTDFKTNGDNFVNAQNWIINVIEEHVDFSELLQNKNYKDMLVKYCQHNSKNNIKFYEVDVSENNNRKIYTSCIKMNGDVVVGVGKGDSKKEAEQNAAKAGLQYFGEFTVVVD